MRVLHNMKTYYITYNKLQVVRKGQCVFNAKTFSSRPTYFSNFYLNLAVFVQKPYTKIQ